MILLLRRALWLFWLWYRKPARRKHIERLERELFPHLFRPSASALYGGPVNGSFSKAYGLFQINAHGLMGSGYAEQQRRLAAGPPGPGPWKWDGFGGTWRNDFVAPGLISGESVRPSD